VTRETQYQGFVSHDLATEQPAMTAVAKSMPGRGRSDPSGIETGRRPRS
jgi:hypothetical protein